MKCPVCPANDIPDDSMVCPVCKADLGPLQRVRQLPIAEYNEAVRLADAGAHDPALRHALAAAALCERFVPAIVLVGKLLWRKGQVSDALDRWEEAASLAPGEQEVRDLLSFGRTFVKRERAHRIIRWSAVVLTVVFLGCVLPLVAALHSRKAAGVLSMRMTALEKMLKDQPTSSGPTGGAGPVLTQSAPPQVAEGPGSPGQATAVMAQVKALCDLQAVMSAQLKADTSKIGALDAALARMQDQGADLSGRMNEVIAQIRTLADRQEAMSLELQGVAGNAKAVDASVAQWRAELAQQQSSVDAYVSRARETVAILVETMKPQCMSDLESRIRDAEDEVSRFKAQEAELRTRIDLIGDLRRLSIKSKLRESQARLASLRAEWQEKVVPWLILKERAVDSTSLDLGAPAGGGGQGARSE